MKTEPSTNLFLFAVAVIVFGLIVNTASTTNAVVGIAFCVSLLVALTGAVVKAVESKRGDNDAS